MSWTLAEMNDAASIVQSLVTSIGLIIAGAWAYRRYVVEESRYPHIETSAEIEIIGSQEAWLIVELRAILTNKGKVRHRIEKFAFDLNSLHKQDVVETRFEWGGQVHFPHKEAEGSFLPSRVDFFFIDPGVTSRYSYVARLPRSAAFLILHCRFEYGYDQRLSHTMEKTILVPSADTDVA